MFNNKSGAGFSNILGKITRKGSSPITAKENFQPVAPAPMSNPDMDARFSALNSIAGGNNFSQAPHLSMPGMKNPTVSSGESKKDKYLGFIRSNH